MKDYEIKEAVRNNYGEVAKKGISSCCGPVSSCCGGGSITESTAKAIGYSEGELSDAPGDSNLGLGCGNPTGLASLKEGERVLDLGSGAGFDCFLAANKVGAKGLVVGVDMTPEMVSRARRIKEKEGFENVEFRLGEIENLPAPDNYFDAVISNCVINLSTDKSRVFREMIRVLKPGGRFIVSDLVLKYELPASVKDLVILYVSCVAGAMIKEEYIEAIKNAGFKEIEILKESGFSFDLIISEPEAKKFLKSAEIPREDLLAAAKAVTSITVSGKK